MTARLALAVLVLSAFSSGEAFAEHKCQCLYQGKKFEQGAFVCIRVDGATRLARCDMLLNNSSWTFVKSGCPTALISPMPRTKLLASLKTD